MILTAPQYFVERLGATPTRAGELLAICSSVNLPGTLLTGVVEQWMASRGMALLRIRRLMSGDDERALGGGFRVECMSVATTVFALHGGSAGAAFKTARGLWGQDDARVRDTFLYRGL